MPKRKRPELKPEEQFRRFQETAREVEADETGKTFEKAFKGLASKRKTATARTQQVRKGAGKT